MRIEDIKRDEKLMKYMNLVLEYNKHFNLTAITNEEEFIEKHLYNSLEILDEFDLSNLTVMDLGSGAGFPGIPLAIVKKDTIFYLVEPIKKRCNFLEIVKKELGLDNVFVINSRVEDLNHDFIEKFNVITSRAVSSLNILVELSAKFLKINGTMIFLKGLKYDEEINQSQNAFKLLDLKYIETKENILPLSKETRYTVYIKKIAHTNSKYPRRYNEIKKRPL